MSPDPVEIGGRGSASPESTPGAVVSHSVHAAEPFAELGYAIGAAHRGQGLAARAVRLMTGYAHETLGMRKVVLRIDPDNAASVAVARRSGFPLTDDPSVARREAELLTWSHES